MILFRPIAPLLALLILALELTEGCATSGKVPPTSRGDVEGGCKNSKADSAFLEGFKFQQARKSQEALQAYGRCLSEEPSCVSCLYEQGWSFWSTGNWEQTVASWEKVLTIDPKNPGVLEYLPAANDKLADLRAGRNADVIRHPRIGTASLPAHSAVKLKLIARLQSYNPSPSDPKDFYDTDINSPKSVRFARSGQRVYVNSLEAEKTLAYDPVHFKKLATISHNFGEADSVLFQESAPFDYVYYTQLNGRNPNVFTGKPVESEFTHHGRFLWIPYYRRDFDLNGTDPSAVAIIDTRTNQIVRVMATGPISKYVTASPDGKYMAISDWGDNTVLLIDVSAKDPAQFKYAYHLVVDQRADLSHMGEVNRDHECGSCLRGLAYSRSGRYLFVARMGGMGGIAIFDLRAAGGPSYLGTATGMRPKPRDVLVSRGGRWLYLSSTHSGFVSRIRVRDLIGEMRENQPDPGDPTAKPPVVEMKGFQEAFVGMGPRSIRLSPDERYLFAAVNTKSEIAVVDTTKMEVVARIPADPYPVGLAVSPGGKRIWVTSQGHGGMGGNCVSVFKVQYRRHP